MCVVAPARVIALDGSTATLDADGRRRTASVLLAPDVLIGDWVIVAGGAVLRRIAAVDADAMRTAVARMAEADPFPNPSTGAPR